MESDVDFIIYLKNKIVFAMAVVLVKEARNEGISAVQYTKTFQERYVKKNQNTIDQVLLQRYLNNCQEEFLQKLRKCIPLPVVSCDIIEDEEDMTAFGVGSLDWNVSPSPPCSTVISKKKVYPVCQTIDKGIDFSSEISALKHLNFIESLMKLKVESEGKSSISSNVLYSLLYDTPEHHKNSVNDRQCSEDSGIGSSEQFSEDNYSVNYVSSDIVKFALQSSNTELVLLNSMRFVIDHVKRELSSNITQIFYNWKGSLVEYTFQILKECSLKNVECKDMLLNLIFNLLEGMWTDRGLSQHFQWEMRIHIANTLLTDYEDCDEVVQYISERLEYVIRQISHKGNGVPLMLEKLCLLLNLYSKVCQKFSKLKLTIDNNNFKLEDESDVTRLWQTTWCQRESNSDIKSMALSPIDEDQIQVLERLIILISKRYPIIASIAKESLKCALELVPKEAPPIYRHDDIEFMSD